MRKKKPRRELSELETRVMEILWTEGPSAAEHVRTRLARSDELTDSSVRTLLRRLESKGYVSHTKDGKRFIFAPAVERSEVAAMAARKIVDSICGGSTSSFLIGMLDDEMISEEEINQIRKSIAQRKKKGR